MQTATYTPPEVALQLHSNSPKGHRSEPEVVPFPAGDPNTDVFVTQTTVSCAH